MVDTMANVKYQHFWGEVPLEFFQKWFESQLENQFKLEKKVTLLWDSVVVTPNLGAQEPNIFQWSKIHKQKYTPRV